MSLLWALGVALLGCAIIVGWPLLVFGPLGTSTVGRMTGTLYTNGKPSRGTLVAVYQNAPQLAPVTVEAGDDGKFVFASLRPEPITFGRRIAVAEYGEEGATTRDVIDGRQTLWIQAGETLVNDVGRDARTIVGRLELADGAAVEVDWQSKNVELLFTRELDAPRLPEGLPESAYDEWRVQYGDTNEDRERRAALPHEYHVFVESEGQIQVHDIVPGYYELSATVWEDGDGGNCHWTGSTKLPVRVESESAPNNTIDVGKVAISIIYPKNLEAGDDAPEFFIADLEENWIRTEDFQGKHLVLDFWSAHSDNAGDEIQERKSLYAAHRGRSDFAMLSIVFSGERALGKELVERHGIAWPVAVLQLSRDAPLPTRYYVNRMPTTFLIGPDGKVVARDLTGPAVAESLAEALGS